jgi:hypothetical protein
MAFGGRARPVDPFLGTIVDQRSDVLVSSTHGRHGVFVVALAVSLACLLRARSVDFDAKTEARRRRRSLAVGLAIAAVLAGFVAVRGDAAGVGWGAPALERALAGRHETEHFVLRYPDEPHVAAAIPRIAQAAEWHHRQLSHAWGVELPAGTRIHVFGSEADIRSHTGQSSAFANFRGVFLTRWLATDDTLAHEIVHAMHRHLDPSWRVLLHRALLEGLAQAYEEHYARLPAAHAREAAALAAGDLPHARSLFGLRGFLEVHEGIAYDAAGSFVGFLILDHGFERFRELNRTLDWRATYGLDLDALDREWRRFLSGVPFDVDAEAEAAYRFDPERNRPFASLDCPRVGEREEPARARARRACATSDWGAARAAFDELWGAGPASDLGFEALACLDRADLPAEGLAWVERIEASAPGPAARRDLDAWEKRLALRLRDWSRLERILDREDPAALSAEDQALARALDDPALRDPLAGVLTENDAAGTSWGALLEEHPRSGPLHFLYALRGIDSWRLADRLWALERFVATDPARAGIAAPELLVVGQEAIERGQPEIARAALGRVVEIGGEIHRFRAELGLARLAFQESRQSP